MRVASSVAALNFVTSVSVWLNRKLKFVLPPIDSGRNVATMSTPSVEVSKSLAKKRKFWRLAALVMPSAISESTSLGLSENSCVTARRSDTSILNRSTVRVVVPCWYTPPKA